jgi:hypothetical protein
VSCKECRFRLIDGFQNAPHGKGEVPKLEAAITKEKENGETNQNMTECPNDLNSSNNCTEVNKMLPHIEVTAHEEPEADYTVILTEHGAAHHGHSHLHGHVHAAPQNFSSVAWMVIMGDGLHNFTDGMAIGAAFSGSVAGGFSTAVAVFCHELPHEVGDFAMLLKAGMSIKQALTYNIISSVLCILGNVLGIWLGLLLKLSRPVLSCPMMFQVRRKLRVLGCSQWQLGLLSISRWLI